jgi:hypothetical protein
LADDDKGGTSWPTMGGTSWPTVVVRSRAAIDIDSIAREYPGALAQYLEGGASRQRGEVASVARVAQPQSMPIVSAPTEP